MTRTQSEQIVREAVIQAVPEIVEEHSIQCDMDTSHGYKTPHEELGCEVRPIRLADMILTIQQNHRPIPMYLVKGQFSGDRMSGLEAEILNGVSVWNLRADSLSEQSDSTIHFLAELFSKGNKNI